jgi:hypothetical protein
MKKCTIVLLLFIGSFYVNAQQLQPFGTGTSAKGFLENQGQIRDQNGNSNSSVLYLYNRDNFNIELKRDGFSYELFTVVSDKEVDEAGLECRLNDDDSRKESRIGSSQRIDIQFIGGNKNCFVTASNANNIHYNFYYARLSYGNLKMFVLIKPSLIGIFMMESI